MKVAYPGVAGALPYLLTISRFDLWNPGYFRFIQEASNIYQTFRKRSVGEFNLNSCVKQNKWKKSQHCFMAIFIEKLKQWDWGGTGLRFFSLTCPSNIHRMETSSEPDLWEQFRKLANSVPCSHSKSTQPGWDAAASTLQSHWHLIHPSCWFVLGKLPTGDVWIHYIWAQLCGCARGCRPLALCSLYHCARWHPWLRYTAGRMGQCWTAEQKGPREGVKGQERRMEKIFLRTGKCGIYYTQTWRQLRRYSSH